MPKKTMERIGLYWFNKFNPEINQYVFGNRRMSSVRNFLKSLPEMEIIEAIDIAHDRFPVMEMDSDYKTFKYFCGICWRKIRRICGEDI